MCLTFSYPSQLKHLLLRAFLAGNLPKKLSKLGVLDERGMKKTKNHCTIVRSEQFLLKSKTYIYIYIYIKCAIWNSSTDSPDSGNSPETM